MNFFALISTPLTISFVVGYFVVVVVVVEQNLCSRRMLGVSGKGRQARKYRCVKLIFKRAAE
jgi:hypothetical protein